MSNKNKVLVIKTGYSETLDKQISYTSSLGDVLRTTSILHLFEDDHVTWLVDQHAFPLLYNNPFIDRILIYNLSSALQLKAENFDTVINFEKVPGLCALSDSITAWRRFGFRFDEVTGTAQAYDKSEDVIDIVLNEDRKKKHSKVWQDALYEMLGHSWKGESYVLGYQPKTQISFDVGLNWAVGNSYPTKAWPLENWKKLVILLENQCLHSWQEGLDDIYKYIDWINSCRLLVTNDSLGMHIAIALKKQVLVIYGPTHPGEVCLYGLGKVISPENHFDCMPCFEPICSNDVFCLDQVSPQKVFEEIKNFISLKNKKALAS